MAVQYVAQFDPSRWSLPVAERAAHVEQIYLDEGIFRAGHAGIDHVIEAFIKLQRNPDALRKLAAHMQAT